MEQSTAGHLSTRLREARKSKGWSQERLAYAAGMEQTDVSKIELGKKIPSEDIVRRLASSLEMDVSTFPGG